MDEQELRNKKLAEWAGFRLECTGVNKEIPVWIEPNGVIPLSPMEYFHGGKNYGLPNFPESINVCFKHLAPKLLEEHALIESYSFKQVSGLYYSETEIWDKGYRDNIKTEVLKCNLVSKAFAQDFDLEKANALALCLAIEKLIDSEKEAKCVSESKS